MYYCNYALQTLFPALKYMVLVSVFVFSVLPVSKICHFIKLTSNLRILFFSALHMLETLIISSSSSTQFSWKILECLTIVVGPIIRSSYLGNPLLAENLSQHFDYCVAVALSPSLSFCQGSRVKGPMSRVEGNIFFWVCCFTPCCRLDFRRSVESGLHVLPRLG